jgi:hypothetical protein
MILEKDTQMYRDVSSMLSLPDGREVGETSVADAVLTIHIVATAKRSACPLCAHAATRVVADVPCGGRQVQWILHVRTCRCETADCSGHMRESGVRFAPHLGIATSPTTILRCTMTLSTSLLKQVSLSGIITCYLFIHRGRLCGAHYLFESVIEKACQEASLVTPDGKPIVTPHRFRHTVFYSPVSHLITASAMHVTRLVA